MGLVQSDPVGWWPALELRGFSRFVAYVGCGGPACESSVFVFSLRRVVWTGWRAHVVLLTLLVSFTLFAGQQKGHPSSWRGLPLRRGRSS